MVTPKYLMIREILKKFALGRPVVEYSISPARNSRWNILVFVHFELVRRRKPYLSFLELLEKRH